VLHINAYKWAQTKGVTAPAAKAYVWTLANGGLIDPTDDEGQLPDGTEGEVIRRWPWPGVTPTLARINEPSPGRDVNVATEEFENDVLFYLEQVGGRSGPGAPPDSP